MDTDSEATGFEGRRRLMQMEMLYEVGLALSESLDPLRVAEQLLQRAVMMVDARSALLLMREQDGASFEVMGSAGLEQDAASAITQLERAWQTREMVQCESSLGGFRHVCIVPLECRDVMSGLLLVADREGREGEVGPFDDNDESLLHSFALQAAAALHNARLHTNLSQAYRELKAAQNKIAQLEQLRALGDLAADVTHTVRHILGLIIGRADLFLNFGKEPERAMSAILASAEEGQELINRIHRATRLGVGRSRAAKNINELLTVAAADAGALAEQSQSGSGEITWKTELTTLPVTFVNAADMKEVFTNLMLNAAEAMPEGGEIEIASAVSGDSIEVRVCDSGLGMSDEVREHIFDPFYTTKEETGAGLGLSIVFRILEDHGASIAVHSQDGKGSTFTVTLPILDAAPVADEGDDAEAHLDSR